MERQLALLVERYVLPRAEIQLPTRSEAKAGPKLARNSRVGGHFRCTPLTLPTTCYARLGLPPVPNQNNSVDGL